MPVTIQPTTLRYKNGNTFTTVDCLKGDPGSISVIAPDYNDLTFPVASGKLCTYNDKLYVANQQIASSEVWTAAHWTEATVEQIIDDKADKTDTVLETTLSRGRKANTTVGENSFAFGNNVTASGANSHAEGDQTTASSIYGAHAEGFQTVASNYAAHAEGNKATASGSVSHAEGLSTTASGTYAHAEGRYTTANHMAQHVFGSYNIIDSPSISTTLKGEYVEIVGNGTDENTRSNARALDWDGNEYLAGNVYVNCNADSTGGTMLQSGMSFVETVSGATPTITGTSNTRYICGEVSTLNITPPAVGIIDVRFTSGSTATVVTVPNTVVFPAWFDITSLEANTVYEIMITDGVYGGVMTWPA